MLLRECPVLEREVDSVKVHRKSGAMYYSKENQLSHCWSGAPFSYPFLAGEVSQPAGALALCSP